MVLSSGQEYLVVCFFLFGLSSFGLMDPPHLENACGSNGYYCIWIIVTKCAISQSYIIALFGRQRSIPENTKLQRKTENTFMMDTGGTLAVTLFFLFKKINALHSTFIKYKHANIIVKNVFLPSLVFSSKFHFLTWTYF